jgi:uncharacterized UBP type Zn finger protein
MAAACTHKDLAAQSPKPGSKGCEECRKLGQKWVELRVCLTCGNVGCCDSTPGRHATAHFEKTGHPVMRSFPDGKWAWCYVDKTYL